MLALLLVVGYLLTPSAVPAHAAPTPRKPLPLVQMPVFGVDVSTVHARIVGGTAAVAHEFPWQAYLLITTSEGTFSCGGSVIMRQYVLTAAHCVTDDMGDAVRASQIRVYLGMHDRRYITARVQARTVTHNFVHASYNAETYDYDIAVLRLNAPLTINAYVKTILLAKPAETGLFAVGNDVTVSGWGTTTYGGDAPNTLRKTTIDVVSRATCNLANSYAGAITNRMLCAGRTGKDSCQGDSGGPLFLRHNGVYKQVGVVSWGNGCAWARYPGVYSHLGVLRPWVATKVPALP